MGYLLSAYVLLICASAYHQSYRISFHMIYKIKSSSNSNEDNKESRELGYDEHEGQLGEKQEEETGEIGASTINQTF
jgi:hypothetical protein